MALKIVLQFVFSITPNTQENLTDSCMRYEVVQALVTVLNQAMAVTCEHKAAPTRAHDTSDGEMTPH